MCYMYADIFVILAQNSHLVMLKRSNWIVLALTGIMCGSMSCSTNVYDEEEYQKIIRYLSPVDSVDQRHTWSLIDSRVYRFNANAGSNITSIQVFTEDPLLAGSQAELMNQKTIKKGESATMMLSVPYALDSLYAALVDGKGNYYVTPFSPNMREVDISDETISAVGMPTSYIPPQTFTYLFEENYPEAGDYDYNDLVLRISTQRTGTKELTINVTIAAVGSDRQLAGGIRLVGKRYDDIETIGTIGAESFNEGVPEGSLYVLDNTDLLVRGRNEEAVINMFVDAHWAMAFNVDVEYGLFKRKKYNVTTSSGSDYQLRSMRTISYVVTFKNDNGLENFTQAMLDPFVMAEYNGNVWETHLDVYRDAQVLCEYPSPSIKDLPWALMVPMRDFRYPLEGNEIGFRKKTSEGVVALFGAYMTIGHSFGEWVEDFTKCRDWYLYPEETKVYNTIKK